MNKIHLIMPMGGRGSRFRDMGDIPKPLIRLNGKPFFYWAVRSISKNIDVADITFVVLQEHVDNYGIDSEINKIFPNAEIIMIPDVLDGAVLTCREGLKAITDDRPVVFNDCDHAFQSHSFEMYCNAGDFTQIDGALLTFKSHEPIFSYLLKDDFNRVVLTVEKEVISNEAICGCYYFKNKDIFLKTMKIYLKECNYQEYFISGMYNIMATNGANIKAFETDYHIPFGVPEEYEIAKKDKRLNALS